MSFRDPVSVEYTAITSPTPCSRTAPMRAMSGPGHTLPRASTIRAAATDSWIMANPSDEQGRLGVLPAVHELAHAGRVVHEVDEVLLRLPEEVHRHRARIDLHVPELLRRPPPLDGARHA